MNPLVPLLALTITASVINDEAALEPSVLNEVEHALDRAPAFRPGEGCVTTNAFATNGLTATAVAIRLVSQQKSDGGWIVNGTNCTTEAVAILSALAGRPHEPTAAPALESKENPK